MKEYIITDGERYIRQNLNNRYVNTTNLSLADTFSKPVANTIIKNSLSKYGRDYYLAYIENGEVVKCGMSENEKRKHKEKATEVAESCEENMIYNKNVFEDQPNVMFWIDRIKALKNLNQDIELKKIEIQRKLHIIEEIFTDIDHHREFKKLDACKSCKRDGADSAVRQKRRALKNELNILEIVSDLGVEDKKIDEVLQKIREIEDKVYSPRILTEVFETDNFSKEKILELIERG